MLSTLPPESATAAQGTFRILGAASNAALARARRMARCVPPVAFLSARSSRNSRLRTLVALALTFLPPSWGKNDPTASDPIDSVAGYEGHESWREIAPITNRAA